jgi:hypothetical protein
VELPDGAADGVAVCWVEDRGVLDPEGVGAVDVGVGVDRDLVPPLRVSRDERRMVTGPCIGQQDTHRPCMLGSIVRILCMVIRMRGRVGIDTIFGTRPALTHIVAKRHLHHRAELSVFADQRRSTL